MLKENPSPEKWFVIEHMEEWLFEWCMCEYIQASKYVSLRKNNLVISNANEFLNNKSTENKENIRNLFERICKEGWNNNVFFHPQPISKALDENLTMMTLKGLSNPVFIEKESLKNSDKSICVPIAKVCLLDLRAETQLNPKDKNIFEILVFGGILGDHPPKDRSRPLRDILGKSMRNLAKMQMSTDTALLTSQIIVSDQIPFQKIPFVDAPEIVNEEDPDNSVILEGFRYVSKQYDMIQGNLKISPTKQIHIHPKIKNEFLFEEFDFANMDLL